jgi:hypothetical protein
MSAPKKSGAPSRETTKRRRAFSPQTPKRASEFLSQPCLRETPLSQWVRRQSIFKHGATFVVGLATSSAGLKPQQLNGGKR